MPDLEIVGSPKSKAELKQQIADLKPQVVIIDHHSHHLFSVEDIQEIARQFKFAHILVLSNNGQHEEITTLSEQGINYISKRCNATEIVEAVYATAKGEPYFCKNIREILQTSQAVELPQLSSREAEIVQLIADGLTNKEIADRLYISIHTIRTHRKNIIKKLGFTFKNAAELASFIQSL